MITREDIELKLEIIHRQMKHCGYDEYYLEPLLEREKWLFSDNIEKYPEAIRQISDLISNPKVWDDMGLAGEDEFVNGFKNFDDYYHFARELVRDINIYNEERLR